VASGTYTLDEAPAHGWVFHRAECDDPDGGTAANSEELPLTIDLDSGESIVCTVYNVPS
jgi:hypothetical protein